MNARWQQIKTNVGLWCNAMQRDASQADPMPMVALQETMGNDGWQ